MKKLLLILFLVAGYGLSAQNLYMTRNGQISFYSSTPMEDIEAVNNEVTSVINTDNGEMAFAVLIKSFHFQKALMEEHFNEEYLESDRLPKATFSGKVTNLNKIDFTKNGSYPAKVKGDLTIHGIKKPVNADGTIEVSNGKIKVISSFLVKPDDYKIKIPSIVAEKIAENITVKVNCEYQPK